MVLANSKATRTIFRLSEHTAKEHGYSRPCSYKQLLFNHKVKKKLYDIFNQKLRKNILTALRFSTSYCGYPNYDKICVVCAFLSRCVSYRSPTDHIFLFSGYTQSAPNLSHWRGCIFTHSPNISTRIRLTFSAPVALRWSVSMKSEGVNKSFAWLKST